MNWPEFISGLYQDRPVQPGIGRVPAFRVAASAEEIAEAELRLNARFPESLRSLLLQADGVMDMLAFDGDEWLEAGWLVWSVAENVEQNGFRRAARERKTYSRDFQRLLFFANAGCDGILFAFPVKEDFVCGPSIVVWRPIEDELEEVVPSLDEFLKGWLAGKITA